MNEINIKYQSNIDEETWNNFINQTENCSLFSTIEYYKLLKANIFFITAYDKDNKLIGGTICRIRGTVFPLSFFSRSLWIESGLLVKKNNDSSEKQIKIDLLKYIEEKARALNCVIISFNHWSRETEREIFSSNSFDVFPNCTFVSDLTLSQEELFARLDNKIKPSLKKARQNSLNFNVVSKANLKLISDFYCLYELTYKRAIKTNKNSSMTLKQQDFINGILQTDKLNCYLSYITYKDKLVAGSILVKMGETIIIYIAASDIEINREVGASSLLFWENILWAKKNGFKYIDFGGVPDNPSPENPAYGVYRFKKRFGGNLKEYLIGKKILAPFRAKVLNTFLNMRYIIRIIMKLSVKF